VVEIQQKLSSRAHKLEYRSFRTIIKFDAIVVMLLYCSKQWRRGKRSSTYQPLSTRLVQSSTGCSGLEKCSRGPRLTLLRSRYQRLGFLPRTELLGSSGQRQMNRLVNVQNTSLYMYSVYVAYCK